MQQVEAKMRADFDASRAAIGHNGAAGTDREGIVLTFLRRYLPASVRVWGSGEILAADGSTSKQCDIIITDPATPPLYVGAGDGHRIVPAECVYGTVEVKTFLDKAQLLSACDNIRSVKSRPKTAYEKGLDQKTVTRYEQVWDHTPTLGTIFAFGGASLDSLGEALSEWCHGVPHHLRPDSVWVLGEGALVWGEPHPSEQLRNFSHGDAAVRALRPVEAGILLPLVLRMNFDLRHAFMPPLDMDAYTQGAGIAQLGSSWGPVQPGV
jgi:hypothetical protein